MRRDGPHSGPGDFAWFDILRPLRPHRDARTLLQEPRYSRLAHWKHNDPVVTLRYKLSGHNPDFAV